MGGLFEHVTPAEPFPALPGTIPENAVKPSMGNGL